MAKPSPYRLRGGRTLRPSMASGHARSLFVVLTLVTGLQPLQQSRSVPTVEVHDHESRSSR